MHKPLLKKFIAVSLFSIFYFLLSSYPVSAQSSTLNDLADVISAGGISDSNVLHSVSFQIPSAATLVSPTDYIQVNLLNFSSVTAPTGLVGPYTGTPVFSVSGNIAKITGVTVLPGAKLYIEGITATNPPAVDQFQVRAFISEDEAGNIIRNLATTVAILTNNTVKVTAEVDNPTARLLLSGFTGPNTFVTFTEDISVIGTDYAGAGGTFSKLFPASIPGDHFINIYGVDSYNRTTSIVNLSIYAPIYQQTTISNILLSPTIEISSTQVLQGDTLTASGSAYPGTNITIFTDSPVRSYTATASAQGLWSYDITNTASYSPGDYRIYAIAQTPSSIQSLFSPSLIFSIITSGGGSGTPCGDISHGDLNCDDIVNLTDFSILMYYWGTTNATADINGSGSVELTDFSIMMYYWGT